MSGFELESGWLLRSSVKGNTRARTEVSFRQRGVIQKAGLLFVGAAARMRRTEVRPMLRRQLISDFAEARNLSGIAFSPRPIQRFAGLVIELWRAGSNPVGSL